MSLFFLVSYNGVMDLHAVLCEGCVYWKAHDIYKVLTYITSSTRPIKQLIPNLASLSYIVHGKKHIPRSLGFPKHAKIMSCEQVFEAAACLKGTYFEFTHWFWWVLNLPVKSDMNIALLKHLFHDQCVQPTFYPHINGDILLSNLKYVLKRDSIQIENVFAIRDKDETVTLQCPPAIFERKNVERLDTMDTCCIETDTKIYMFKELK